jgi:hypothetical protein
MNIFPVGPLSFGMAELELHKVQRDPSGQILARYTLSPVAMNEFVDRIGGLRNWLGHKYAPIPGYWSTFMVPDQRDDIEFVVGIDPAYGKSLVAAHKALKTKSPTIVTPFMVRTLALGYLAKAGV